MHFMSVVMAPNASFQHVENAGGQIKCLIVICEDTPDNQQCYFKILKALLMAGIETISTFSRWYSFGGSMNLAPVT